MADFDKIFLSTLSLRRATIGKYAQNAVTGISIHALLAESDNSKINICYGDLISIHALLAESDGNYYNYNRNPHNFYPRSPCGERPRQCLRLSFLPHFYPRSPCGERLCDLRALL